MVPLAGVSGTATRDAAKLGINPSLQYTVRIVATTSSRQPGRS